MAQGAVRPAAVRGMARIIPMTPPRAEPQKKTETMIASGFPWCVAGDQGDVMAYFKHKHHAEAFCLLANAEAGEDS